jgi:hypothetical protein
MPKEMPEGGEHYIDLSEISKRSLDALDVAPPTGNYAPFEPQASMQPLSEPMETQGPEASLGDTE